MRPDAPGWALVVCPARQNPAQGNLNSMPQIMGLAKFRANVAGTQAPADSMLAALVLFWARCTCKNPSTAARAHSR